jgi:hypothetical protein
VYDRKRSTAIVSPALPGRPLKNPTAHAEHAAKQRWESVKEDRELWMSPFYANSIEKAMAYLEDLRKIVEEGGHILNDRIGKDKSRMRCAGPTCGKDLSAMRPNGMPMWIAKKDLRDKDHPEIIRSLFFCSALCEQTWVRRAGGAMGGDGR